MKLSDYILLFLGIMAALLLPPFVGQHITQAATDRQTQYSQYLTNACMAATADSDISDGLAYNTEEERSRAVDNFYETLSLCLNVKNTTSQMEVPYYVPAVILIDNDGFYVSYNDYDGSQYHLVTTTLNVYEKSYGDLNVRFFLDGRYDIINTGTGSYEHYMNAETAYSAYPALSFLATPQEEARERAVVAVNAVQAQAQYYINYHNTYIHLYKASYTFTMPKIAGEDWANLMDSPGVLSFLQGIKMSYGKGHVNIYSLAGSRISKSEKYFLQEASDGTAYYHAAGCPYLSSEPARVFTTMEEAAAYGAWPCNRCILRSN